MTLTREEILEDALARIVDLFDTGGPKYSIYVEAEIDTTSGVVTLDGVLDSIQQAVVDDALAVLYDNNNPTEFFDGNEV